MTVRESDVVLKPFTIKDKLGYMFGDFGNDFFFIMASSFLTIFYTNVLGISGAMVGTLFLVARFFDAFTDIGMGRLIDSVARHSDGRYRVWIKRMMVPVVCSGVLLFVPWVATWAEPLRLVYIYVTYILWGSFMYTSINIPYGSMASVLTDDPVQRSALSTFRSLGAALAGAIVGSLTPQIIYVNGVMDGNRVFFVACVFAVLALVCYYMCYIWSTERIIIEKNPEQKQTAGQLVKALLTNRALISFIITAIISLLSMLLTQSMNMYLYQDYFKDIQAMSVAGLMSTACMILVAPFAGTLTKKFGKKESAGVGLIFAGCIYIALFFMHVENAWLFIFMLLLANLGAGIFQMMCWAFISDIIDYQTFITGSNDGGTVYGLYSFARKVGQALAGGLGGFALTAIGYQSAVAGQAVQQSAETLNGIYSIATLAPGIGYLLVAVVLIFWYPLSKKKMDEIRVGLEEKAAKSKA